MAGASDFIACFLAGCMVNWDGWYQEETAGQAFAEIVDMYLATVGYPLEFAPYKADQVVYLPLHRCSATFRLLARRYKHCRWMAIVCARCGDLDTKAVAICDPDGKPTIPGNHSSD